MRFPSGATPDKLGRYVIEKRIGNGSMGMVLLAKDPTIERVVAIKLIQGAAHLDPTQFEKYKNRFYREAQAAGKLLHPGIVTVFDIGHTDEGIPFIVMEYVQGKTLTAVLEEGLELEESLQIACDLLDALGYAHSNGVVHRDFKPGNVLITPERHAKIMDFGIAHVVGSELTPTDQVIGSPYYMAPEQLWKGPVDQRTDLFAFGVVLYRMVTGKLPFVGDSFAAVANAVVTEKPASPVQLNPSLPPALGEIILRCLTKEPAQRFWNAQEVKEALVSLDSMNPLSAVLDGEKESPSHPEPEATQQAIAKPEAIDKPDRQAGIDLATELELEATEEEQLPLRRRSGPAWRVPALIGIGLTIALIFARGRTPQPEPPPPSQTEIVALEVDALPRADEVGLEQDGEAWEAEEVSEPPPPDARKEVKSQKAAPSPTRTPPPVNQAAKPDSATKVDEPVAAERPVVPEPPTKSELLEKARSELEKGQLKQSRATLQALLKAHPEFSDASILLLEVTDLLWMRTLPISCAARHNHRIGGCTGELVLENGAILFRSETHGEWRWSRDEILSMRQENEWELVIETSEKELPLLGKSKSYKFKLLEAPLQEEFWRRYQRLMGPGPAGS